MAASDAAADTLEWALVQAYQNNPSLNAPSDPVSSLAHHRHARH